MARFTRRELLAPAPEVARLLIGARLISRIDGHLTTVRLVETEAYAPDDPASHSFIGPTARNATMFARPGLLYVYLSYGVHACLNVVTGPEGEGSAVLLRAAEPLEGLDVMAGRRGSELPRNLCSGPGKLAESLGLDVSHDGLDLVRGDLAWLERSPGAAGVVAGARVGISKGTDRPWRFVEEGSAWASRPSLSGRGSVPSS